MGKRSLPKRFVYLVAGVAFVCLFAGAVPMAHGATLEWVNPTTYADGSPLDGINATEGFTRLYKGVCGTDMATWARFPEDAYTIYWPKNTHDFSVPYNGSIIPPEENMCYTAKAVVRCDQSLPMSGDNKCASDFAVPVKYTTATPPPPPPPPTGKNPKAPGQLKFR